MGRIIDILIGIALISYLVKKILGRNFKEADRKGHTGKAFPRGEVFPKVDVYEFPKEVKPIPVQEVEPELESQYQSQETLELLEGGYKSVKDIARERQKSEIVETNVEQAPKKKIDAKKMIIYSEIMKPKFV